MPLDDEQDRALGAALRRPRSAAPGGPTAAPCRRRERCSPSLLPPRKPGVASVFAAARSKSGPARRTSLRRSVGGLLLLPSCPRRPGPGLEPCRLAAARCRLSPWPMMALPDLSGHHPSPAGIRALGTVGSVGAPLPPLGSRRRRVDLVLPERGEPDLTDAARSRTPARAGWWQLAVPDAGPGTDYAYRVDGSDPLPDPRSAWQPRGVHGAEPGLRRRAARVVRRGLGRAARRRAASWARCSTSCTSGRSPRSARSTRRSSGSAIWSTSASTSSS